MEKIKFTDNEREVLKRLIENGRETSTNIARDLGISPQAVCKIIDKLEKTGVIEGYIAKVGFESVGVKVIVTVMFDFREGLVSEEVCKGVLGGVKQAPHLIWAYPVNGEGYTHIGIYGFRSFREYEHYIQLLRKCIQRYTGGAADIKRIHVTSASGFIKRNPTALFVKVLEEGGREGLAEPIQLEELPQ